MAKQGYYRITKKEFYARGGFKNSKLFRKADKNGRWLYYRIIDND